MTAWALYELPAIGPCARCDRPSGSPFHSPKYSNAHRYEPPIGADGYGAPVLVGVAPTAEAAERWRDEPAEGVKREIGSVPIVGKSALDFIAEDATAFAEGVLTERQRAGEGRDGLAGLDAGPLGVFYAIDLAARIVEDPALAASIDCEGLAADLRRHADGIRSLATSAGLLDEPAAQPALEPAYQCDRFRKLANGRERCVLDKGHEGDCEFGIEAFARRVAREQAHPAPDPLHSPGDDVCPECEAWPCIYGTGELAAERARRLDDADDEIHRATGESRC